MSEKDSIADAFQRHFNHFGFKKTSVDEVARELKISKKTVYQHFNTKEEIFYYLVSRVAQQYRNRMAHELEDYPTYREKITQLIRMIFAESRKWLKSNDAFEFRYKTEIGALAFQDTYAGLIAELVQQGMVQDEFTIQPVETAARFVRGIISASTDALKANPNQNVEDETIQAILKLLE
jgi:AcrR family transcriptional regulator